MASADQGHTTATLVLTASTALAAGAALGTLLASRELQTKAKRLKKSLLTLLGSHPTANGLGSPTSSVGEKLFVLFWAQYWWFFVVVVVVFPPPGPTSSTVGSCLALVHSSIQLHKGVSWLI